MISNLDLDPEHTLNADRPGDLVRKFGHDPSICLEGEAILSTHTHLFALPLNCPYLVTFDLDLDLEPP